MKPQDQIKVRLFGSLRDFGSPDFFVDRVRTIGELREALGSQLAEKFPTSKVREILRDSAFADEKSVLSQDTLLDGRDWIAVLPPVCGG